MWNHGGLLSKQSVKGQGQSEHTFMFLILAGKGSHAYGCARDPYHKTFHGNQFWEFAKALGGDKKEECSEKMIDPFHCSKLPFLNFC